MSLPLTKQIKIQDDTYEELTDLRKKNETYDQIIRKCIESYKRELTKGERKKEYRK
jgi:predicted CopG family antitoxin